MLYRMIGIDTKIIDAKIACLKNLKRPEKYSSTATPPAENKNEYIPIVKLNI